MSLLPHGRKKPRLNAGLSLLKKFSRKAARSLPEIILNLRQIKPVKAVTRNKVKKGGFFYVIQRICHYPGK
jgi:hypothetical protein